MNVNRKRKLEEDDLQGLSREELIERVKVLAIHNNQLKNTIRKQNEPDKDEGNKKKGRAFDFSKCHKRKILLRFFYLGWNYQGFASQEGSSATIEHHIFAALKRTCLIEDRSTSDYHRCGRTDKGVSAFCQVISLNIRSKFSPEEQLLEESIQNEIAYCQILNRVLPEEIRMVAWLPLRNPKFSARFDCISRTYRYFFPSGNLNIGRMREAAQHLLGVHDFRNLCKMDVANGVVAFVRSIDEVRIVGPEREATDMMYLEIRGKAFLWHQIRCIMSILLLIGEGQEDPKVIQELLDVDKNPRKPQYSLARDVPLNLYEVKYRDHSEEGDEEIKEDLKWIPEKDERIIKDLQRLWAGHAIKAKMIDSMILDLESEWGTTGIFTQAESLIEGVRSKKYIPLLNRDKCDSLEGRIEHYVKKKRLVVDETS